jgi:ribosomal protein S18 acetylase RimI-like enzyme
MPEVEIRRLKIEDYEAIIKVWKLAGLPHRPRGRDSRENTAKQMELYPDFYLGAFLGKKLIGVAIASYESRTKGWINRLAVDPAHQGQGVAEQLVRKAEESLKKHGARIFCALIELPNDRSVKLFQRMGYSLHKDILYVTKRESLDV